MVSAYWMINTNRRMLKTDTVRDLLGFAQWFVKADSVLGCSAQLPCVIQPVDGHEHGKTIPSHLMLSQLLADSLAIFEKTSLSRN